MTARANATLWRPATLDAAAANRAAGHVPMAGGTIMVPLLAAGRVPLGGQSILDLDGLECLKHVERQPQTLRIGALSTVDRLSGLEEPIFAALHDAAARFGNANVRRLATVGGNIGWLSGPADLLVALMALDATVGLREGPSQLELPARSIRAELQQRALLITELRVPAIAERRSAYARAAPRRASARSLAAVAAAVDWQEGHAVNARVAVGGAIEPRLCTEAGAWLEGSTLDGSVTRRAAEAVAGAVEDALQGTHGVPYLASVAGSVARDVFTLLGERAG